MTAYRIDQLRFAALSLLKVIEEVDTWICSAPSDDEAYQCPPIAVEIRRLEEATRETTLLLVGFRERLAELHPSGVSSEGCTKPSYCELVLELANTRQLRMQAVQWTCTDNGKHVAGC